METTSVLVFGSGGHAKEVIGYIESETPRRYTVVGVVSSEDFDTWNKEYAGRYPVTRAVPLVSFHVRYLLAVADPVLKRVLVQKHAQHADRWVSYVSPRAYVSPFARVGRGSILCAGATVLGDGLVGEFTTMNIGSNVGHDCILGDYSTMSPHAQFGGGTHTGPGCFFGIAACTKPGVRVAPDVKASMHAVIRSDIVTPGVTVYGDPAKLREQS